MNEIRRKIKNILFDEQKRIMTNVVTLMILSLVSKFSGMLFSALLTQRFGADRPTDIFNAANAIPEMVTTILLVGTVSGSIIPSLIRSKENDTEEGFIRFFNSLFNVGFIAFSFITIFIVVFSNDVVHFAINTKIINPDIPFLDSEIRQIGDMMRLLTLPQAILGISAYISTVLNVHNRFIIPSLAPIFYNVGKIFGVYVLSGIFGMDINGILWGTILGSLLHLAIQIPLLRHVGLVYRPVIDFRNRYLIDAAWLALPKVISLSVEQFGALVDKILALSMNKGALTNLGLAVNLVNLPLSLFGSSYAHASFPTLSKYFEKKDIKSFSELFRNILNQIFFLAVFASVVIIVLRIPFARIFYGIFGGEFSWESTKQVAWIVFFFSIGLSFETLRTFIYRVFYSFNDSIRPLIISIFILALSVTFSIGLSNYFSHTGSNYQLTEVFGTFDIFDIDVVNKNGFPEITKFQLNPSINIFPNMNPENFLTRSNGENAPGGIALGSSLTFIIEFLLLMIILARKKIIIGMRSIVSDLFKKILAGISTLYVSYLVMKFWEELLDTTKTLNLFILTICVIFASLSFYLWISKLMKIPEVDIVINNFVRSINRIFRLFRSKSKVEKKQLLES